MKNGQNLGQSKYPKNGAIAAHLKMLDKISDTNRTGIRQNGTNPGHQDNTLVSCPDVPKSKMRDLISKIWGSEMRLIGCVSRSLRSRFERQLEKLENATDKEKILSALDRAWVALDAEARARGHAPDIEVWIGINETSRQPVALSLHAFELDGVAVFHPSELIQFVPPHVMNLKGSFGAHVASWKYSKLGDDIPFDDPIPF